MKFRFNGETEDQLIPIPSAPQEHRIKPDDKELPSGNQYFA
jgi:hypothetical protein